jgi:hypothetical protein
MSEEKVFIKGMTVKAPRENAPSFVKASIGINIKDLVAFLGGFHSEWINIDIKESKGGKWYAELNTWQKGDVKSEPIATIEYPTDEVNDGDVPF